MADNMNEPASPAPQMEAHPATSKATAPPAGSTIAIVSTILTYYPLRDAISILILLLSLPPTLVLVIQTLFASLTFVPPTAGISLSTLPHIKDMFSATSLGYPALATILFIDLVFYLLWLPVWKPMQSMFLDLSQTVIAVSLSGAAASNGGPTYSILTCSTIVCVVHMLRYKAIHLTALDYLRSVLHKMDFGVDVKIPSSATAFILSPPSPGHWVYTLCRTILGIHIVSQGVTTCIRRYLASANERSSQTPSITRSDPEAAAGVDSMQRSNSTDGSSHLPNVGSGDGRPPGQPPAYRESRVRESSSKKKRKQANQVRSQQPLWAAIASTKVTFVKEMEQRDAADDAKEAASMDNDISNTSTTSNIPTNTSDRIWICDVHDTDIVFGVELSPVSTSENSNRAEDSLSVSAGIDKTKPFYVRVNGAAWSSTRIGPSNAAEEAGTRSWKGEIFGLAPLSSYRCEIVGIVSQTVLCSVNMITLAAPMTEQTISSSVQPQHQTLRPASPITTLKQSIQQAEAKLAESRSRTKKSKKDQRAALADIKREVNALKGKLDNSGGLDDKQARRLQQISQHKNQAEEATAELKEQIDAFGEVPADEVRGSEANRRTWQSALDAKTGANKDHDGTKSEAERELSSIRSEICTAESKREKLSSRRKQRKEELEQAVTRQQADYSAKQKQELDRQRKREEQEQHEGQANFHINHMNAESESFVQKGVEAYQQGLAIQSYATAPPSGLKGYSSPPTPENATNGPLSPSNGFPTFVPSQFPPQFQPASQPNPYPRGRSSSMLSQYSGFTEVNEDGDQFPYELPHHQHTWPMQSNATVGAPVSYDDGRNQSEGPGSGSSGTNGSTASNSPRPDATAKPFVPGAVPSARPSPIAPPTKARQSPGIQNGHGPGTIGSGR